MAGHTLAVAFVASIDDGRQVGSRSRLGVAELGVTSQAETALFIEGQILDVVRVIARRTMAILTLHALVRRTTMFLDIVFMTLATRLCTSVLDGKVFPFLDIAEPMVIVGKTISMNAEIVRDHKGPGEKNQSYQSDCNP
jgi:hypothetical protein